MKVEDKEPVKIDPLWKRVLFLLLAVVAIPIAAIALGVIAGVLWRLFVAGWNVS